MNCFAVFLALPACVSIFSSQIFASTDAHAEEAAVLRAEIERYDELYYREGTHEISDLEYDALKARLNEFESSNPIKPIGDDRRKGFEKARHIVPMRSLDKAYGESDLVAFYERIATNSIEQNPRFVVEPKVDGVAISLIYEKGKLARAVSRGNGREGDVMTKQIQGIMGAPLLLNTNQSDGISIPDLLEIRGEIHVPISDFDRINTERIAAGEDPFSTPRSLAAGSIRLRDREVVRSRGLCLVVFGWGEWGPRETRPQSYTAFKELAKSWGFKVLESGVKVDNAETMLPVIKSQLEAVKQAQIPCDGIVIKVDDVSLQESLGESEQSPNWALACKFRADSAISRINNIRLQVGRSGAVTPVAEIAPVKINNRVIRRVNLHNAAFISLMDIRIGDQVVVELSGDVIPVITGRDKSAPRDALPVYTFPETCPFCNANLEVSGEGRSHRCGNYACPERTKRRMEHFVDMVGFTGTGTIAISKLVDGEGECSLAGLVDSLDGGETRLGEIEFWKLIAGLGIPGIGPSSARKISVGIDSLKELMDSSRNSLEELQLLPSVINAILAYIANPDARREIEELQKLL